MSRCWDLQARKEFGFLAKGFFALFFLPATVRNSMMAEVEYITRREERATWPREKGASRASKVHV